MVVAGYGQFGWRVYSKIACDMRAKDGKSKQHTFLLIHGFLTLLKLDALVGFLGVTPCSHAILTFHSFGPILRDDFNQTLANASLVTCWHMCSCSSLPL